jgi:hypothetical protein
MPSPTASCRDLLAFAFATITTLALVELPCGPVAEQATPEASRGERAIDRLIDAESAAEVGSWWLDEPTTTTKLSFDPGHERLVWQVSGRSARVLLDAATGEALAFEFEFGHS